MASLADKFEADFHASKVEDSSQRVFVYTCALNSRLSRGTASQVAKFIRDRMPEKTFIENDDCDIAKTGILATFTDTQEFNTAIKSIIMLKRGRISKINSGY